MLTFGGNHNLRREGTEVEIDGLLRLPGSDCQEWFNTTIDLNRYQYRNSHERR